MEVKDYELNDEMNYSDEESNTRQEVKPKRKFRQQVDTNVFKISMQTIKDGQDHLFAGDPIFCKWCHAAFNIYSKIEENKGEGIDA